MAVFHEVSFVYQGDEYTLTPDLALLRRIKARGINNVILANSCVKGGVDLEDLAVVVVEMVKAAGGSTTEEEAYGTLSGEDIAEAQSIQWAYVQAVLPKVDFGKKPEARAVKGRGQTKRKRKT